MLHFAPMAKIFAPTLVPVVVENSLIELGSRLAIARKARSLTQADLARLGDVGVSTVSSLEAGYHGVSLGNLLKVVKALDLLPQVDRWLDPSLDSEVVSFATRKLGGHHGR